MHFKFLWPLSSFGVSLLMWVLTSSSVLLLHLNRPVISLSNMELWTRQVKNWWGYLSFEWMTSLKPQRPFKRYDILPAAAQRQLLHTGKNNATFVHEGLKKITAWIQPFFQSLCCSGCSVRAATNALKDSNQYRAVASDYLNDSSCCRY